MTTSIDNAKRPYGWSEDDYEMLHELFKLGLSNDEIAAGMNRTVSTVSAALRRIGLNRGRDYCATCGVKIEQPASGRRRKYCSSACGQAFRTNPNGDRDVAALQLDRMPVCTVCQTTLTAEQVRRRTVKKLSLDYCSGNCKQTALRARQADVPAEEPL